MLQSKRHSGENNPMYGRHHTEETLKKMRKSKKKLLWKTPAGDLVYMDSRNAKVFHPDWVCIESENNKND